MSSFYDIYVPSLKQYKAFSEIDTKQQKVLTKCVMAEEGPYKTELLKCMVKIIKENSVDVFDVESLNLIDCMCIMMALKCYSIKPSLLYDITCNTCKTTHKINVNLINLYDSLSKADLEPQELIVNDTKLICTIPSIKKELEIMYKFKNKSNQETTYKESIILNILRFISFPETNLSINFFDEYNINDLKKVAKLITKYNDTLSVFYAYKIKCLGPTCNKILERQLKFDYGHLYDFLKLIFNDDLKAIYKDIYYLNKIGIQASYTDTMTPLERNIYWSFYVEEQKNKAKNKGITI